jgi:hypothetical protein
MERWGTLGFEAFFTSYAREWQCDNYVMPYSAGQAKKAHNPHEPQRCFGLRWGSLGLKTIERKSVKHAADHAS